MTTHFAFLPTEFRTKYPPRRVAGFYKKDELARLIRRRTQRQTLDVAQVKDAIVERYYQKPGKRGGSFSE